MSIITPPPFGRPDYSQPLLVTDGVPLLAANTLPADGSENLFTINCQGFQYLDIIGLDSFEPFSLTFSWNPDPNGQTNVATTETIGIPGFASLQQQLHIPCRQQFVSVAGTDLSGSDNPVTFYYWLSNRVGRSPFNAPMQPIWFSNGGTILPGNNTLTPSWPYGGPVVFSSTSSGTYNVQVNWFDESGNWDYVWGQNGYTANNPTTQIFTLPFGFCQLVIDNTEGSNQTISYSVSPFSGMTD